MNLIYFEKLVVTVSLVSGSACLSLDIAIREAMVCPI